MTSYQTLGPKPLWNNFVQEYVEQLRCGAKAHVLLMVMSSNASYVDYIFFTDG